MRPRRELSSRSYEQHQSASVRQQSPLLVGVSLLGAAAVRVDVVAVVRVDVAAGTFDAHAVPPGRRAVHGLPLAHITHASLEEREIRQAEHRARRERLSREAAQALAVLQAAAEDEGAGADPALVGHAEAKRRRLARQISILTLPAVPVHSPSVAAGVGGVGGGRIIHYRPPARELPADLADDDEAVAVWLAATEMKRLSAAGDRWVCGWRMRTVTRNTGGVADLYIRSPEMDPGTMANKHETGATAIRSMIALIDKLRERRDLGLSSGSATAGPSAQPLVRAAVFFAPSTQSVRLELQACSFTQ